jgi:RNA polymerase sigma-70 factor (ECF subfamily)
LRERARKEAKVIPDHLEDKALMERIARGNAGAFRDLSNQYLGSIVTFATRLMKSQADREAIAQETFLRAWQNASKYEPTAKLSTWLHTIARKIAIDRLRKKSRSEEAFELDDERDEAPLSGRPSRLLAKKQEQDGVQQALAELPERQRSAILLCHEQGLTNPEIARILETSVEATESLLARARRRLRQIVEGESPEGPSS